MSGRAYMSDRDARDRWLSCMETHYTATVEETGVTPEDWVLNTAWAEARAILAETESKCVPDRPSMFPQDRGICCAVNEATDALAESLRSFLEA